MCTANKNGYNYAYCSNHSYLSWAIPSVVLATAMAVLEVEVEVEVLEDVLA